MTMKMTMTRKKMRTKIRGKSLRDVET
jgi:hypothetical protein